MRRFFAAILGLLGLGLTLADGLTLIAQQHRFFDYLSGYRLQYLVGGALLLALFLFVPRRGLVRLSAWCVALVIGHQLWTLLPRVAEKPPLGPTANETSARVISFNLLHSNRHTEEVLWYLRETEADLLTLFESIKHWPPALHALGDEWPHHLQFDAMDMEIFSKHPIVSHRLYPIGDYRGFVECEVLVGDDLLTVVLNHTYPPFHFGQQGYEWRNEQFTKLASTFSGHTHPLLVVGDFNASIWSPFFRSLVETTGWNVAQTGPIPIGTYARIAPQTLWFAQPTDHGLGNHAVRIYQTQIGPYLGSDHRPIVIDLALSAGED